MPQVFSRRSFLRTAMGTGLALALPRGLAGCGGEGPAVTATTRPPRVLFISIDSFPPAYLTLNSRGEKGGRDGDWLMPNVRRFLEEATLFADARDYLPAATDMNHLNAVAGTSSAQTGINSVSIQAYNWNADGKARMERPSLSWARDDRGRPVDTLFAAWKRRWPGSRTFYLTGKSWVGEMFRVPNSGVDTIVTGSNFPGYLSPPPEKYNFYDPPGDEDARSDPESIIQAGGALLFLTRDPEHFPCDAWIVDSALQVLDRERPDLGVILMAQLDDTQHSFGSVSDPDDYVSCGNRPCGFQSRRNPWSFREPVLDAARDVDRQFGRLIEGILSMPDYRDAVLVLYSDHGHANHLRQDDLGKSTDMVEILYQAGAISEAEKKGNGFSPMGLSSMGALYWRADSLEDRRDRARTAGEVLLRYRTLNPETGVSECPWAVAAHEDMIRGIAGVAQPGELWHPYFGPNNDRENLLWPDLVVLMKNGWQAPTYGNILENVGIILPFTIPPITIFVGGHGAPDTQRILMAMRGPGIARGRVITDPGYAADYRISDLALTVAQLCGLRLVSTTVGRDRCADLAG